jgi:hypothetical protein
MSKKKNTLKDLNEFLKQQAATLVSPPKLTERPEQETQLQVSPIMQEARPEISPETILNDLKHLSKKESAQFRKRFYDLIIKSIEAQSDSLPEDKMLINTALYLKHGERWKEAIRDYWRSQD